MGFNSGFKGLIKFQWCPHCLSRQPNNPARTPPEAFTRTPVLSEAICQEIHAMTLCNALAVAEWCGGKDPPSAPKLKHMTRGNDPDRQ